MTDSKVDKLPSLGQWWNQLNEFDYWYEMSDDHRVYKKGLKQQEAIDHVLALAEIEGIPDYARLATEFYAFKQGTSTNKPEFPT